MDDPTGRAPDRRGRTPRPPLDDAALTALALAYAARYATTRRRLADYLRRKLAERGWDGPGPPPVDALVARMADAAYVDDRAFAEMRGAALTRRGYGARRVSDALRAAGVAGEDGGTAVETARAEARAAALAYARRRRIGPFAATPPDADARRRALAAMMRAGHDLALSREIVQATDVEDTDTCD